MKRNSKLVLITFAAVLVAVIGLIGFRIYMGMKMAAFGPPPEAVTSAIVTEHPWQDQFEGVGSLDPTQGATLAAEESGRVSKINFESGTRVEAGAVLIELDTSVEEANLKGALAMKARMAKAFERAEALRTKNAISSDEYDNTSAQFQQSVAQADSLAATIKRKKIVAPFSGVAGIRTVNVGDFVNAGKLIVPLYAVDELYVNFMVPQKLALQVHTGQKVTITTESDSSKQFEGTVTAVNPNIDEASRNFSVQGTIKNIEGSLKPGMFASVALDLGDLQNRLTIPVTSIQYAPYGDSVYVIEKQKEGEPATVRQQFVKIGAKRGDQVSIVSGLKVGEEVVTSGLFKMHPGAKVNVNNEVKPSDAQNPAPQNT